MDDDRRVDLLALCRIAHGSTWNFIAREAQRPDGLDSLLVGRAHERGREAERGLAELSAAHDELDQHRRWVHDEIAAARDDGISMTTVLDDDYPINLRTVFDLPPFLFYRGTLHYDDAWSVAVSEHDTRALTGCRGA